MTMLRRDFIGMASAVAALAVGSNVGVTGSGRVLVASQDDGPLTQVWTDGDPKLVLEFVYGYMDALHPLWRQDRVSKFCLDKHAEFMLREGYTFANCAYERSQASMEHAICNSAVPVLKKSAAEFCRDKLRAFTLQFAITVQECTEMLTSTRKG